MSRTRAYNADTIAIMTRFYEAVDASRDSGRIKSLSRFLEENGIDKRHFYTQRKELSRGFFEVGWLVPLIRQCGVSPVWLLTARPPIFIQ